MRSLCFLVAAFRGACGILLTSDNNGGDDDGSADIEEWTLAAHTLLQSSDGLVSGQSDLVSLADSSGISFFARAPSDGTDSRTEFRKTIVKFCLLDRRKCFFFGPPSSCF